MKSKVNNINKGHTGLTNGIKTISGPFFVITNAIRNYKIFRGICGWSILKSIIESIKAALPNLKER